MRWLAAFALWLLPASALLAQGPDARKSGFETMSPALQAMQADDLANPAMLTAGEGERLWSIIPPGAKSCKGCHGEAEASMKGVSTRYPAFDTTRGHALTLGGRINQCRVDRQGRPGLQPESRELVALEAFLALQSRGMPIQPSVDPRLSTPRETGKALFFRRLGQLDLSCAQCHEDNAGKRLGGSIIPQGHATGYPLYRLEWQTTGTLARRIRNCLTGIRAEPFAPEASEMIALELYLQSRSEGMLSDAPGVRP